VINEAFARRFFKNENPLGKHFGPDKIQYASRYEIVGVVKDMRYMTYDDKDPIGPWMPEAQTTHWDDPDFEAGEIWSHYLDNIVIWAPGNPPGIEEKVRKALASVDPDLVLYGVDSYDKVVRGAKERRLPRRRRREGRGPRRTTSSTTRIRHRAEYACPRGWAACAEWRRQGSRSGSLPYCTI
jgi:hypothetical protein